MKILITILTAILLVASAGLGALMHHVDKEDTHDITEKIEEFKTQYKVVPDADTKELDEFINESLTKAGLPLPETLTRASLLALLAAILALLSLVMYFFNNKYLKFSVLALVVVGLVSIFLHPAIDKGEYGGMSNQLGALIQGGIGVLGGLTALYGQRLKNN